MFAESNWISAVAPEPVNKLSCNTSGALMAAATISPESPRLTETSPLRKLIRATPLAASSAGSSAQIGLDSTELAASSKLNRVGFMEHLIYFWFGGCTLRTTG